MSNLMRGDSQVIGVCFNRLTKVRKAESFAYEDEWSFFLLGFCTSVSKMGTSSSWEVNSNLSSVFPTIITNLVCCLMAIAKEISASHCLELGLSELYITLLYAQFNQGMFFKLKKNSFYVYTKIQFCLAY